MFLPDKAARDAPPPGTLFGTPGALVIEARTPNEAMTDIIGQLVSRDLEPHDLRLAQRRLAGLNSDDAVLPSLIAQDLLADFLAIQLLKRQLMVLDLAERHVTPSSPQAHPRDWFTDLRCAAEAVPGLADVHLEYVRQLCATQAATIGQYLARTGGLLNIPTSVAVTDVGAQQTIAAINNLNKTAQDLAESTQHIETLIFERLTAQEQAELLGRIATLEKALGDARTELARRSDTPKLFVEAATKASKSVGELYVAISASQYGAAARSAANAARDTAEVINILGSSDPAKSSREEVQRLEAIQRTLRSSYTDFLASAASGRAAVAARADGLLKNTLDLRRRVSRERRLFSADFDRLLKFSLIGYARNPTRSAGTLLTPLRTMRDVLQRWPDPTLGAFPQAPPDLCAGVSPIPFEEFAPRRLLTCAAVSGSEPVTMHVAAPGTSLGGLPLLVVAPAPAISAVNYGGVLRRSDVIVTGADMRAVVRGAASQPPATRPQRNWFDWLRGLFARP